MKIQLLWISVESVFLFGMCSTSHQMVRMTKILDKMLDGYDKRLRPGFGGPPIVVYADILVRSMGPISERDMMYSMDCYYRQTWEDKRLAFNLNREHISLSIKFLERIWHPDTVFFNGRRSYLHTITTPNRFLRINRNGTILFSQRLTIRATCRMRLEKFPMDTQQCPLELGSFGYSTSDVIYLWRKGFKDSVELALDMTLNQFDLIGYPQSNSTITIKGAPHTVLTVRFFLRRHSGFFLIQVYIPCVLLVILSWVSFWINREATADRIALGTMTVLTMTFLGLENRTDLPKVSYATALDFYVAVCFAFVLATIIQFAMVHYFTKYGTGDMMVSMHFEGDSSDDDEGEDESEVLTLGTLEKLNGNACVTETFEHSDRRTKNYICKFWNCLTGTRNYTGLKRRKDNLMNSVSQIDKLSRIAFPATFIAFNAAYWAAYLL